MIKKSQRYKTRPTTNHIGAEQPHQVSKRSNAADNGSTQHNADTVMQPSPTAVAVPKQTLVIELLKRSEGASLNELVLATGWQKHSLRGLISGTLKKKHGLSIASEKTVEGAVYRIAAPSETNDAS